MQSNNKLVRKGLDPMALVLPLILLALWILVSEAGWIPGYILPKPIEILKVAVDFFTGSEGLSPYAGTFWPNFVASVVRVLLGFVLAAGFGLVLGFYTGEYPMAKRILDPMVHALRAVPGIGWLPLAMVWFGVGQKTTLFLIALAAFFPIYINVAHGVASVPPLFLRAGRMLGADKRTLLRRVILPSAFPSALVGLRLGLGIAWAYLVLGELTGVSEGLGAIMMDARMLGQTEMIFVTMIFIAILGKLSDVLLVKLCGLLYPAERKRVRR